MPEVLIEETDAGDGVVCKACCDEEPTVDGVFMLDTFPPPFMVNGELEVAGCLRMISVADKLCDRFIFMPEEPTRTVELER